MIHNDEGWNLSYACLPDILKRVWQRAICNEYLRVLLGPLKLANMPVNVVPILEPRVSGKTRSRLTKPIPCLLLHCSFNVSL